MYELEKAINHWRSGLLQNQSILESDADELENHLRDEVDSLILAGLNAEEAFMVSSYRIGDNEAVGQEFAKVNSGIAWRRRAFWMFFGILASMLVTGIADICSKGSAALLTWLNINAYVSGVASTLIHIGVFVVILFGVIFGLSLFTKAMKGKISVSIVLILCMISILALKAVAVAFQVLGVHLLSMEALTKMMVASAYTNFAWQILWPVIVVVMLFVLWSSRPQQIR